MTRVTASIHNNLNAHPGLLPYLYKHQIYSRLRPQAIYPVSATDRWGVLSPAAETHGNSQPPEQKSGYETQPLI